MYNAGPSRTFPCYEDIIGGQLVMLDSTETSVATVAVYNGESYPIGIAAADSFADNVAVIPWGNRTYEFYIGYGGCSLGDALTWDVDLGAWVVAGSGEDVLAIALRDSGAGGKVECIRIG